MPISIPNTKSKLAVSNMSDTINTIKNTYRLRAITPNWLMGQVDVFSESLDSYVIAGGDPSELSLSIRACETLSIAVVTLLGSGWHLKPYVDEHFFHMMGEVVININAITESLGQPCYGADLCDRWNAFVVQSEDC